MPESPATPTPSFDTPSAPRKNLARLTALSVIGLVAGLVTGLLILRSGGGNLSGLPGITAAFSRAWTSALSAVVLPLVVSRLYLAVAARREQQAPLGRTGLTAVAVFLGMLALTALVTVAATILIMRLPWLRNLAITGLAGTSTTGANAAASGGASSWVDGFVAPNLFAAASNGAILPLMLAAVAFGLASFRLNAESRHAIELLLRGVADGALVVVDWLLVPIPLVMFAFGVQAGETSGLVLGSVLIAYVVLEIVLMVLATILLYPITILAGPYPPFRLVRAVLPAQLTAAASRSSLATLPALTHAADSLRIPDTVSAFVIPLAGATLKLSRSVANPLKLVFLATLLGITLTPSAIVVFVVSVIMVSPATPGLPSVTIRSNSLPAFVAAGVPPQYVLLLGLSVGFSDVFQTILNTTSYLCAAVLTSRLSRARNTVPASTIEEIPAVG